MCSVLVPATSASPKNPAPKVRDIKYMINESIPNVCGDEIPALVVCFPAFATAAITNTDTDTSPLPRGFLSPPHNAKRDSPLPGGERDPAAHTTLLHPFIIHRKSMLDDETGRGGGDPSLDSRFVRGQGECLGGLPLPPGKVCWVGID